MSKMNKPESLKVLRISSMIFAQCTVINWFMQPSLSWSFPFFLLNTSEEDLEVHDNKDADAETASVELKQTVM